MLKGVHHRVKKHWRKLKRSKHTPHEIGLGFAIGVFIAVMPTPGGNILLGLLIAWCAKKISKIALLGALALGNPFFLPAIYYSGYEIGDAILHGWKFPYVKIHVLEISLDAGVRLLLGTFIIGIITSTLGYYIVSTLVARHRGAKSAMRST